MPAPTKKDVRAALTKAIVFTIAMLLIIAVTLAAAWWYVAVR